MKIRTKSPVCALLVAAGLLWTGTAQGQAAVPGVFAIVGARIEIGDGRVLEKGTVVLRDGIIEAVGADVKPPADAEIIKGDGLVVYPGFVDAHATGNLKLPDAQPAQDTPPDSGLFAPPFMREANRKGVRPEIRAVDSLAFTEAALNTLRQNGFTTQMLTPTGGMMNGLGGLVNLSGKPRRESVVRSVLASEFAFRSGGGGFGGGFPGSLLGIFSQMRQTLLDAQRYALQKAAFERGNAQRPPDDAVLESLQPVLKGTLPVVFEADSENEIARALKFCDEFSLKPVVSGGLYAFKHTDQLAKKQVPVLVSLNFGPEPGVKPTTAPAKASTPPAGTPPVVPPALATPPVTPPNPPPPGRGPRVEPEDKDTPKAVIAERKRLWDEKVANAAALQKAGIVFAFSTRGLRSPSDFWENLRRAVKAGLPKDAALRALTLTPAKLFGVERQMGTVEAGKIATLTVLSGDFTDAKSKVKYLFIDRSKFEPEKDAPADGLTRPMRPRPTHDDDN